MAFASDTHETGAGVTAGQASGPVKAPLSANPAFPWIVALWFAALFGFGSLVLPTALIESIVAAIGLPAVMASAAPPLGFKAHMLIALVTGIGGGIAGFVLARKVAAKQNAPAPRTARDLNPHSRESRGPLDRPAKKPISAQEELGSEKFDEPVTPGFGQVAGRRRALSVTDENARSDYLFEAPVAGGDQLAGGAFDAAFSEPRPLDLDDFEVEDDADYEEEEMADTSLDGLLARNKAAAIKEQAEVTAVEFAAEPEFETQFVTESVEDEEHHFVNAPEPFVTEGGATPMPTPIPASAPAAAIQSASVQFAQPAAPAPVPFVQPEQDTPSMPEPITFDPAENGAENDSHDTAEQAHIASRALRDLGTVELVERFALALQSHKEKTAEQARAAVEVPLALPTFGSHASAGSKISEGTEEEIDFVPPPPFNFGEPAPEEVSLPEGFGAPAAAAALEPQEFEPQVFEAQEAAFSADADSSAAETPTPQVPDFMRPVDATENEDDDMGDLPDLSMPQDHYAEEEEQDDYSSLLSMRSAFSAEDDFVRVEEPASGETAPAVVFPSQQNASPAPAAPISSTDRAADDVTPLVHKSTAFGAPQQQAADAGETEKALREALEKLQRMSGAA